MAYEIKELGVGGILDQTFAIFRDHFTKILAVICVLYLPINLVLSLAMQYAKPELPPNPTPQQALAAVSALPMLLLVTMMLINIVVGPLTNAAMLQTVAHVYLGKPVTLGTAFGLALRRLGPLLWTTMLYGFLVMLGFFALVIPGIYLSLRWALALDVVILEDKSGFAALKRSKELMLSNRTKHYNTLVLLYVLVIIISLCVEGVTGLIPSAMLQVVAQVFVNGVMIAFVTTAFAVFYFSCRCRADNFDITHLAETLESQPGDGDVMAPIAE